MSAVLITYIFGRPNIALGQFVPLYVAYIIGISASAIGLILYFIVLLKTRVLKKEEQVSVY